MDLDGAGWQRLWPGVYSTRSGPLTWEMRAHAALLHAGEGAVLVGASAAYLLRIRRRAPQVITVAIPESRRARRIAGMRVTRHTGLTSIELQGSSVTDGADTVLDCVSSPLVDEQDGVGMIADAVRVGAESILEVTVLRRVIRAHRLPAMACQAYDAHGGGRLRRDFENAQYGVVLEVDGRLGHEGSGRLADLRRDRKSAGAGRVTLRAGWVDAHVDPCDLALDLFSTFISRGYAGSIDPCGRGGPVHGHVPRSAR